MRTCAQMIFGGYRLPGIYVLVVPVAGPLHTLSGWT